MNVALLCSTNTCWMPNVCQAFGQVLETEMNPPGLAQSPAKEPVKPNHWAKVQGVLWGRKHQVPGRMGQVCLTHCGRKFQKGVLQDITLKLRHYVLSKQARFLLASLAAHRTGDILRLKSTKILKPFFTCLSLLYICTIQFGDLSTESDIYPYQVSSC